MRLQKGLDNPVGRRDSGVCPAAEFTQQNPVCNRRGGEVWRYSHPRSLWLCSSVSLKKQAHPLVYKAMGSFIRHVAAAAAKSLQSTAHQALLSLGSSRQEHWSGLPFPSPVNESEKWKWSRPVVSNSQRTHGPQPTRLLCPRDSPGTSTGVGYHCLLQLDTLDRNKAFLRAQSDYAPKHYVTVLWLFRHQ